MLRNAAGSQTINVHYGGHGSFRVHACAKTATPTNNGGGYVSGCADLGTGGGDKTVTVTQTMINNGGFVMVVREDHAFSNRVRRAQWIPLVSPDIVLSESSITVAEGSPDVTYNVRLNVRPTGNVKVRVARGGLSFVMRSGTSNVLSQDLEFTQSNWNTAQTITVRALDDNNVAGESTNITHTTVDADTADEYDSASETLTVTVTDDDGEMVVSRSGALALTEGSSGTYNVKLKGQPASGQVAVIRVSSGDGNVVSVNKTGGTAGASQDLTFTNSNWNTNQTVTLTAEHDNDAADPSSVTITHAVIDASTTANEFDDAADVTFAVNVSDDDGGIVVSQSATLTIAEGNSGTYNVKLDGQPASGQVVVVRVSSSDDGAVSVNKTGGTAAAHQDLTFTNSSWNTNQAVTLTGEQDDDTDNESVTITHTVRDAQTTANEFDDAADVTFTAAVTDDESVEVRVSATSLTVTEATGSGRTATFTVRLGSRPTADVVIGVSGDDASEGSVSPLELTFTQTNWNQTQQVTVTAVDDDVDDGNVDWDVTLASPTSADTDYSGLSSRTVDVSTTDDDTKGVTVSAATSGVTVTEASGTGRSATYTVVLTSEPTGNVTVTPSSGSTNVAEVTTSRADDTLVFTANNWDTAQDVTVTGVDNAVDESSDLTTTISHAVTGAAGSDYASGVTAASVTVTLTDNDSKSVIISKSSETINESGAGNSFTYTVKLGSQPTATVTVTVSAPSGIAMVDTTSLTFEANDNSNKIWSRAQDVTVTAVDNNVDDATARSGDVTHTVGGAGSGYESGVTPGSVTVTLTDDDTAGITTGSVSGQATEDAGTSTFTVRLATLPTSNVVIDVTSEDTGEGTASPTQLTFTPTGTNGRWDQTQTVTVTGVDDSLVDGTQSYDISLAVSSTGTTDTNYRNLAAKKVRVSTTDNDTPGVIVTAADPLVVSEGSSGTYNVRLATQPTGNVTVTIASDNPDVKVKTGSGTAQGSLTLTFEADNTNSRIWSTNQAVSVEVSADTDSLDETATLTQSIGSGSASEYSSVSVDNVAVSVTDVTLAGLSIADAEASEGSGTLAFTVTLSMASSRTVTVDWTLAAGTATAGTQAGGDYDDSTDTGTLTFSSGGSLTQTISVPIVDDPDVEPNETVEVTLSGQNPSGVVVTGSPATGTIRDDDTAGVRVTPERSQRTTTEDAAGTVDLMVSLSSRPSADVKVTVTSLDTTEGKVKEEGEDDPVLDFTTGNWNTPHRVTVTGVDDDDLDGDVEYNVRFAFSDGPGTGEDTDYTGLDPVDVALTNLDDDLSILSVSGGGEVAEGDSGTTAQATFTVTLAPARRQAVSVSYATSDGTAEAGSDYESASGTVTFSPGETSKTVTVTINGDDEAEANETFTLTLASTPNGQIDPQNSSAGAVIKNDDEKMVDAGMSGEFSVGETTVTVDSTLAADTGLEVMLPAELESGGAAIEELTVTLGPTEREIDGDLFGYTGSGDDHVLVDIDVSPVPDEAVRICLPVTEGLRRAAGSQRLYLIRFSGGRWEELTSETEDDMVCADVRGFSPFAVVFQIDYAKRRVGEVNRAILPELSRAMTASTLEAITSRIDDAMAGGVGTGAFGAPSPPEQEYGYAEPGLRLGEFEDGEELSLTDAVDGSYYSVSLAGGYDPLLEEEEPEAEPAPAPRSGGLGMWISGDYRNLSGKGGGLVDWDGRVISGHLGADYRFGRSFLAGVATSWSQGSFDYTGRGEGSARVSGDYGSRMNSFHPYLGLSLSERLGLWAAGGWGFGEIRMDDGEITGRQRASTRLGTLAAGADLTLLGGDASSLSLKGEAWISRVKVKGNGGRIEGLRVKTNRLRAALEGSHALAFGSGSLVPSLEFAIRRDGGDGETGVGGELGGGISLVSSTGLTVEARGRGLLFHQGDAKEWGVGGSVRFDPGGDERGLSMSVIPSWGNSSSGVQSLWESEGAEVGSSGAERSLSLETEIGYGFAALGDRGLLTPYGAFGRAGGDGRSYRAGSRLSMGGKFDVSLEGLRTETGTGDPEHGITLQGRLNW